MDDVEDIKEEAEGLPLCPHCLEIQDPNANFCHACGSPVSSYAFIGPLERIYAVGWLLQKESNRPSPLFRQAILALAIMCGLVWIVSLLFISNVIGMSRSPEDAAPYWVALTLHSIILFFLVRKTIRNYRSQLDEGKE